MISCTSTLEARIVLNDFLITQVGHLFRADLFFILRLIIRTGTKVTTADCNSYMVVLKWETQYMRQENGMIKIVHFSQTLSVKNLAKVHLKVKS